MSQFFFKRFFILIFICIILFFLGNSSFPLTDPDEVFYAQTAKEMAQRQEWLTPYIFGQPQFEKPILTYWFIKASFTMFGETPFAARFFPALFATLGVLAVYALGLLGFINERRAFLSGIILATSAFYLGMGKTVFTDMIFTVFILYSLLSFYLAYTHPIHKRIGLLGFYLFAALAVLTKGPLGFLIPELIVVMFLLYRNEVNFLKSKWMLIGFLLGLIVTVPWFWYEISKYGQAFIQEFFFNSHWRRFLEAEHKVNDRWYFYLLTMLGGIFPWTIFFMASLIDLYKKLKYPVKSFEHFLLSWILIVFFVFQFAHSKLTSYILPMFPAMALLIANYLDEKIEEEARVVKKLNYLLIVFLTVSGFLIVLLFKSLEIYVPTIMPAYWLSGSLITLSGISLTFLIKDRIYEATLTLAFCLLPIFMTAFMVSPFLQPYISMQEASSYIPITNSKSKVLTSKLYARGIHYFTNQEVAVMGMGEEKSFFSPHPIPIYNTKEELVRFLKLQPQTYAVLKRADFEDLTKTVTEEFSIDILKKSAGNYILKIAPLKAS
jgi:4-amino-4-deoxy-L-arabinose transferase-like glycosyltransferase